MALAVVAFALFGRAAVADEGPRQVALRFAELDRAYEDLALELDPIRQGVLELRLSSPRNTLVLRRHELRLVEKVAGGYAAELEVEIEGSGRLHVDVGLGEAGTRFTDDVVLPPQRFVLPGEIELRLRPGGLEVHTLALPPGVRLKVETGLGRQLAAACAGLPLMPCDGLEDIFGSVRVPLPPAGETYLLPRAELSEAEWGAVVALVGAE